MLVPVLGRGSQEAGLSPAVSAGKEPTAPGSTGMNGVAVVSQMKTVKVPKSAPHNTTPSASGSG